MPASTYVVASADQLGGYTVPSRVRSQQSRRVKFDAQAASDASLLRREKHSVRGRTLQNAQATTPPTAGPLAELYFSPVLTTSPAKTTSSLCPAPLACARHASKNNAIPARRPPIRELTITIEQLNLIVNALTCAPIIRSSLQKQYLSFAAVDESSALYSLSNKQFATRMAQDVAPDLRLLNGRAGGSCLFDATTKGNPVIVTSAIHTTDSLRPGTRTGMALPDSLPAVTRLAYLPPSVSGMMAKVMLQSVRATANRKTNDRDHFLSVEDDVTPSFIKTALAELARISDLPLSSIKVVSDIAHAFNRSEVDWSDVADALQATGESADIVDNTLKAIRVLDAKTCAMQTLTLLAELSKVKLCNRDFLILALTRDREADRVTKTTVPFWSESLAASLTAKALGVTSTIAKEVTERFVHTVVDSVYPCGYYKEEFALSDQAGLRNILRCIPMYEHDHQKPKSWAVIIEPGAKTALLSSGHF